jgi:poly(A) polymerase
MIPALEGLSKVPQDPRWHPEGDVWTHTLLVIENLPPNATFTMSLSALFHDVGKATTTVIGAGSA